MRRINHSSRFIEMFGNPLSAEQKYPLKRLADCVDINPRRPQLSLSDTDQVSFVPMPCVSEEGYLQNVESVDYGTVKKGFTYFEEGDVLFAKITPCMENGKGAIAEDLINGIGMGSTEYHVLREKPEVSNKYWILAFTRLPIFREDAAKNMTGTGGQKRVGASYLSDFRIGLPPIEAQQEFEQLYRQSDKSKFSDFKSRFIAHFLGSSYTKKRLGDVCSVFSGKTVDLTKENEGGPIAYLKVADLSLPENDRVITTSSRFVSEQTAKASGLVPIGATIFPKNGAAALHNKKRITSVITCVDMNTMAVYSTSDTVMPEYLYGYLESQDLAALTLVGAIPQIRAKDVQSLTIPVPSVREQEQYVAIMHQADKSKYLN